MMLLQICLAALPLAALFLLVWGIYIEPGLFGITRLRVELPGADRQLDGMLIAHLSDLHLGNKTPTAWAGPGKSPTELSPRGARLAGLLHSLHPDLILVSGDYLADDGGSAAAAGLCRSVPSACGWVGVLGNSDHCFDAEALISALRGAGTVILRNSCSFVPYRDSGIWLIGLDDPHSGRDDAAAALAHLPPGEIPAIGLLHSPDGAMPLFPRCGLVLAGHTHGGQVRLPLIGPLITKSRYGRRFAAGLYQMAGSLLYVNRGIGFSGGPPIPIRLNCRPEILLITIAAPDAGAQVSSARRQAADGSIRDQKA